MTAYQNSVNLLLCEKCLKLWVLYVSALEKPWRIKYN
jgi:hypothetical protein